MTGKVTFYISIVVFGILMLSVVLARPQQLWIVAAILAAGLLGFTITFLTRGHAK